jgi:ammonia channel protein AmtB
MWWAFGYSVSFAPGSPWLGGFQWSGLAGVNAAPNADYGPWVSHNVYAMYQMMFAIITPALIVGAIAERMRFSALMVFCMAWMVIVYFPVTHMMWGVGGWMNGLWNAKAAIRAIDFAGGIVVHMTSGWSALALCLLLGPRRGFGREPIPPHSMVLCMVGTGMLWFGWYGFNAGSAVAADKIAANAFTIAADTTADQLGVFTVPGAAWTVNQWAGKTLTMPSGTPACCAILANSMAMRGVISAGLNTMAQPAANAGARADAGGPTAGSPPPQPLPSPPPVTRCLIFVRRSSPPPPPPPAP